MLGPSMASTFDIFLIKYVYQTIGTPIEYIFYIGTMASAIAMLVTYYFDEKLDVENLNLRGYI